MVVGVDTVVLVVGTFAVLGFSVSFTVPTLVGAAEILRAKKQVELIPGQRPVLQSFPQRVVLILVRDWPRFFYVVSILFFFSGILDLSFISLSVWVGGFDPTDLLYGAIAFDLAAVLALTLGWVWLLISAARYSADEVQSIAEEAAKTATVRDYVEPVAAKAKRSGKGNQGKGR